MNATRSVQVDLHDDFWSRYKQLVSEEILPYQLRAMKDELPNVPPSHAIENLRIAAGDVQGEFYGMVFQDSDVAKWIEAAAYSLKDHPSADLEREIDELVDLLGRAQQPDGYLNSYFTVMEHRENRWSNLRDCHELYCAGHLIEAGVAYFQVTGKRKLLDIVIRYANLIDSVFGDEDGKLAGYPGHPGIEMALVRLYEVTSNKNYLDLARFFVRQRGTQPHYFDLEAERRLTLDPAPMPFPIINPGDVTPEKLNYGLGYAFQQAHEPFLEQREAKGHAVRAGYLYSAAADLVLHTGDQEIAESLHALWQDVTQRKMYITGCTGSQVPGESFTSAYDLPNEGMYCETCAAVSLVFLAKRMLKLDAKSEYADVMERALYNGSIAGMDLDGKGYFYINPQQYTKEMDGRILGWDISQPRNQRLAWLDCACCPANLARLLASVDDYIYTVREESVSVNLYIGSQLATTVGDNEWGFSMETTLPWGNSVTIVTRGQGRKDLSLRVPQWSPQIEVTLNGQPVTGATKKDGYLHIDREWIAGDTIEILFDVAPRRVYANLQVSSNIGKVALQRGPFVYAFEESDNGSTMNQLRLPAESELVDEPWGNELGGVVAVKAQGQRAVNSPTDLYFTEHQISEEQQDLVAIPYYAWANRQPGEMQVWIRQ